MPLATFNPEIDPSPGTTMTPTIALNESSFGDGYTQASPKGLNHIRRSLSLKWTVLTPDQAADLDAFFMGQGGYLSFYYTHPADGVARKWTCKEWSRTFGAPFQFQATLVESFTLAT